MTTEELLIVKEYLLKNLYKGFIILNNSPFVSSIFFIAKSNSGLYFYIDYYKFNSLIKKDQHLLSLIDKTLV